MHAAKTFAVGLLAASLVSVVSVAGAFASPGYTKDEAKKDEAKKDEAVKEEPKKVEAPAGPAVGSIAPDFTLKDTDGKEHKLSDYTKAGKVVVLEWFNPDCPFIKKHHVMHTSMADLYAAQKKLNVAWFAVNSSAPGKQGNGLERNQQAKKDYKIEYPILLDESGAVGRMYGAKTTPHMFVIAPDGKLLYKGAFDDDKSPGTLGKTMYVQTAVTRFEAGEKIEPAETVSYGCSVKYGDK